VCSGVTHREPGGVVDGDLAWEIVVFGGSWGGGKDGNGENLGRDDIVVPGRVAVGLWRRLLEGYLHFSVPPRSKEKEKKRKETEEV